MEPNKDFDYIMHYEPTGKGLQWQVFSEPLVRCKNCKWYAETEDEEGNVYPTCEHPEEGGGWTRGKDWFCADGEPKEEVEK